MLQKISLLNKDIENLYDIVSMLDTEAQWDLS